MRFKLCFIATVIIITAQPISAQWAGTNPVYLTTGNVGIGTSTPAVKLHVSGGHIAASNDDALSGFTQLWSDNAIMWKSGNIQGRLRFGSATDLNAGNWSEKMCITDGGNLGIGTNSPIATLHVDASNQTSGDQAAFFEKPRAATNAAYYYTFDNVGGVIANNIDAYWRGFHLAAPYITVNGTNTYPRLGIYAQYDAYTDPTVKKWVINSANSTVAHDIQFISSDINLMYLTANGNIGIGTTTPAVKLDVNGDAQLNSGNADGARLIWKGGINGTQEYRARVAPFGALSFFPGEGGPNALVLDHNGSVGIGTISTNDPAYKLFVETGIRTRKIKVDQTAWPDYIFSNSRELLPLHEVEQYIQQNHHLPEVPSAEEVKKDGLDLGDNQATLLKKIEELTLYVIEQNKRQEAQNQQLKEQEELIKKLNRLVENQQERINTLEKSR